MDFGVGHPEKIADWAYRAVHEMTTTAKIVVEKFQGRAAARSYFSGCSTGGQQALSEAQRYPGDYDGIVAGAPGNNRINLIYGFLWSWLATHDADGMPILTSAKLPALSKAAIAACDRNDGLESVARANGGLDETRSFFRFFVAPGMAHCGGGAGPNTFDALAALEAWVEKGIVPESIPASHATAGTVDRTRPLCAWPAVARYKGPGGVDSLLPRCHRLCGGAHVRERRQGRRRAGRRG